MITNQSVNVPSLAEPIAAINKSHQQLPPQRSLRARSSLKALTQTSLQPEQQNNSHNDNRDDNKAHHKISSSSSSGSSTNEKDNIIIMPEERRGSALVSEIMRRLSRAQPALPTHDIHIHDTSNLSEDNEDKENNDDDITSTGQVKKKSLSDLPILRIPVPPSILKTSSESMPHKVEGRKIQFIDPILSNSSSEVDSMSNASSSMLEQTPDKRLGLNHDTTTFIVSSGKNNNNNDNDNPERLHQLQQMNAYYHENTPLKENEVIVNNVTQNNDVPVITNFNDVNKNINTAKSSSSPSSVSSSSSSSSSSVVSSPAFGSLESTPHQHNNSQVQSSLPSLAQVHPLMETNRPHNNKELARVSEQTSNQNHTPSVLKEVHRAAPLPARPRMSREPVKANKSNSNIVVTNLEKAKSSPKKEVSENDMCNNNNKQDTNNKENDLHKVNSNSSGDNDNVNVKNVNNINSNNDSQHVDHSSSAEDHFSIPPFRHEPHTSAPSTLQTPQQSELTKAELAHQLQKYEEEVRQNAERSLRPSGQSVPQTHPVSNSAIDAPSLLFTQNVEPAETVQVNRNTQANNKMAIDSKAENKSKANSKELGMKKSETSNNNEYTEEEEQQYLTNTVEVPLIDTSLTPEIEYEFPHVPPVNQTNRQEIGKIRTTTTTHEQLPKENNLLNTNNNSNNKNNTNRLANHINNEQTDAQMQNAVEQADHNVSAEQPESADSKIENAYYGNDTTQSMLYLLLYNELSGSKNKHSLEYLMNRWEKRQKRDLAKRMQEVLGIDSHLGQHQIKEKSKHKRHHKSHGSVKQEHDRTKEKSGSTKQKDMDKHKRHQSHKHKQLFPHKHKHKHHHKDNSNHEKHQDEQKDSKKVHEEPHKENKEEEKDHNVNKEDQNTENKEVYLTTDILNDFACEDSKPSDNNNRNNTNVKKTTAELSVNEERHIDYKTLSLEELKAAARRYGLEFAEKTQNWEEQSHQTLPSFTYISTSSLYHNYNDNSNSNLRSSANNYVHERQTRTALREKYLGRRTLSPSAGIDKYGSNAHFTQAHYHEPWSYKEHKRTNYFDDHHDVWNGEAHTNKCTFAHELYEPYNNVNGVNLEGKHYFNDYKESANNNNNTNNINTYKNVNNNDGDDVHSYHSYQDNDNLFHEFYRHSPSIYSSPFMPTRHEYVPPRSSHFDRPVHRVDSVRRKRFASPLAPPTPDTNASQRPSTYFGSSVNNENDKKYYDLYGRVDKLAEPNQNVPTSVHADLPMYEVRDLRAARELASGVRTIIHSLNSYVNLT